MSYPNKIKMILDYWMSSVINHKWMLSKGIVVMEIIFGQLETVYDGQVNRYKVVQVDLGTNIPKKNPKIITLTRNYIDICKVKKSERL